MIESLSKGIDITQNDRSTVFKEDGFLLHFNSKDTSYENAEMNRHQKGC